MRRLAVVLTLSLLAAGIARADWPATGVRVQSDFFAAKGVWYSHIFDLPSGDLGVILSSRDGNGTAYQYQRVTRDGNIASGWPASGVGLANTVTGAQPRWQAYVADDSGYFWHGWTSSASRVQRVSPTAVISPPGSPGYDTFANSDGSPTRIAPDGTGAAFLTCGSNSLRRITRTGGAVTGWTTPLSLPADLLSDNVMTPDGSGGVIVFVTENSSSDLPTAFRVDANRTFHAGWPAGGLVLSTISPNRIGIYDSALLPSGTDHYIAAWLTGTDQVPGLLYLQRFGLDGTRDPAWPAAGVVPLPADSLLAPTFVPDGSGGVYFLRWNNWEPRATHIASNGTIVGSADVPVLDAGAVWVPFATSSLQATMVADATPNGGLIVGWGDTRHGISSLRVRWLQPDLTPTPGKPDTGLTVYPTTPITVTTTMAAIHADGNNAAFIAWGAPGTFGTGELWMAHVTASPASAVPAWSPFLLALAALLTGGAAAFRLSRRRTVPQRG